jgi:C1A family cysteine protease
MTGATADEIRQEIHAHGPAPAGICVAKAVVNYTSGVILASECSGCDKVDHDVNLVGWGVDSSNVSYWLVRNNWGTAWGDGGYFRIERGVNACVIEHGVRAVTPYVL